MEYKMGDRHARWRPDRLLVAFVVWGLLLALSGPLAADYEGDPEEGEIIAYTCTGCHGIPGYNNVYPTYRVPRIGGQNYGYIVASLKAYRDGSRRHPTMNAQAMTLSDEDIHDVAAYFVSLTEDEDS